MFSPRVYEVHRHGRSAHTAVLLVTPEGACRYAFDSIAAAADWAERVLGSNPDATILPAPQTKGTT